jgi:hypothetical protein
MVALMQVYKVMKVLTASVETSKQVTARPTSGAHSALKGVATQN